MKHPPSAISRQPSAIRQRLAFTLVEPLVVIAIIALLAALLLPSLKTARAKAHDAVCIGNLRQLAIGSIVYADDFDGYPPNNLSTAGLTRPWYILLRDAKLLPDRWGPARNVPRLDGGTYWVDEKGSGYGANLSTPPPLGSSAWCPAAQVTAELAGGPSANYYHNPQLRALWGPTGYDYYYGTSYSMNNWLTTDSPNFWGHYGGGAQPWGRYTLQDLGATGEADKVLLLFCTPSQRAGAAGPGRTLGQMYPVPYQPFEASALNLRHKNHWNAVHWDGHASAYRESGWEYAAWPANRMYPWWPRRQGAVWPGDTGPKMGSYDSSIVMTQLR